MKITTVWKQIHSQLAKENKKFIFSAIRKSARGREYETAIQWLLDAGLIYKALNVSTAKIPLDAYTQENIFKVYLLDVGLLVAFTGLPVSILVEGDRLFTEFKGALIENLVATILAPDNDKKLYYWSSQHRAEVDFVVPHELNLIPLEVKAGISNKKKSLLVYGEKFSPSKLCRTTLMNLRRDGDCGRATGDLFIGGRQPWCQPDLSNDEDIHDIVLRCPTGALTASFADGSGVSSENEENHVTVTHNGPLYFRGQMKIDDVTGDMPGTRYRAALCRCGASKNKPFCDNSHIDAGFADSGAVGKSGPGHSDEDGELTVKSLPDGPLMITGNLTINSSSGRVAWKGEKAFLCRCGESKNKPFCDGGHNAAGFKSD